MTTAVMEKEIKFGSVEYLLNEIAKGLVDNPIHRTFSEWLNENYFLNGEAFNLNARSPFEAIYADNSQHMAVMKSAQCGVSEYLIAYALYFPIEFRENVFYAMPAKEQVRDFVQGRVDPRIDDSTKLQELIHKTDNTGLKQVGLNFIYFRGSQNTRQIKTVDAGLLVLDEYDEMIQANISLMEKRLGDSKYKIIKKASTPTYFEYGIHQEYLESDQHEYFLKCDKCGKWQMPDWSLNITPAPTRDKSIPVPDSVDLICSDCKAPLNRSQHGEWRAQNPGALKRGYHISKLMFEITDLKALWREFQETRNLQDFYNSNLGVPYASSGGKLDDQILNACREDYKIDKPTNCTMGVDVGDLLNVRVSQRDGSKKRAVFIGTVKHFEELDTLMKRFDIRRCVIDGLPETREATKFAGRFPGRVYLAYYQLNDHNKTFEYKEADRVLKTPAKVNINRNRAMDETGMRFVERENVIPMDANLIPNYFDQLKAPQKVKITDENGNEEYKYVEGNRADHYFHAEVYDDIAGTGQRSYQIFMV